MRDSGRKLVYIEDQDIEAIIFRNFSGKPDKFHPNGQMPNFWVVLNPDKAAELGSMGMNIRERENQNGDMEYRLQVFVRFDNFPPTVYKICGDVQLRLDEDTIVDLDRDEIEKVDLSISPYHYEMNGREGIKAYLSKGYFTIVEDRLDKVYRELNKIHEEESLPFGE